MARKPKLPEVVPRDQRGAVVKVGDILYRVGSWPPYLCVCHGDYTVKEITPRGVVVLEVGGYLDYFKRVPHHIVRQCLLIRKVLV